LGANKIKGKSGGFTLIELMLVSAIIGLLASIAIPKYSSFVIRAKEASIRAHLGAFRSAITIYYADNEGIFPEGPLEKNLQGKYLDKFPTISIPTVPTHLSSNKIYSVGTNTTPPVINAGLLDFGLIPGPGSSAFAWLYNAFGGGRIWVNCSHNDSQGNDWNSQ
jgi:prepilin-type N-terminal cleavage/methylation domain-containing protein